jgi:hypothetical protein
MKRGHLNSVICGQTSSVLTDGDEFGRGRSLSGAPPGTSPVRGLNAAERQRTMTGVLKAVGVRPASGIAATENPRDPAPGSPAFHRHRRRPHAAGRFNYRSRISAAFLGFRIVRRQIALQSMQLQAMSGPDPRDPSCRTCRGPLPTGASSNASSRPTAHKCGVQDPRFELGA